MSVPERVDRAVNMTQRSWNRHRPAHTVVCHLCSPHVEQSVLGSVDYATSPRRCGATTTVVGAQWMRANAGCTSWSHPEHLARRSCPRDVANTAAVRTNSIERAVPVRGTRCYQHRGNHRDHALSAQELRTVPFAPFRSGLLATVVFAAARV